MASDGMKEGEGRKVTEERWRKEGEGRKEGRE
jgi:hypothetical protein